jgi:hypothetical protein
MPINTLFAAAQLNYVAIRVVHEHRHLPAFAKADRFCGIATSFVPNLDSAFDAGYIDSARRIRSLCFYRWLEQVSS